MPTIRQALICAVAIMAVALIGFADLIPQALAKALITTLPLLMAMIIIRRPCARTWREA